jgi:hypothetical protein
MNGGPARYVPMSVWDLAGRPRRLTLDTALKKM